MKKKTMALVVCILFVLSLLGGCEAEKENVAETMNENEEVSIAAEENEVTEDSEERILPLTDEVVTYTAWWPFPDAFATNFDISECDSFVELEERTNIHIDFVTANTPAATEALYLMLSTGEYTDMIYQFNTRYSADLATAIEEDIIIDLSDIIQNEMPNYAKILNSNKDFQRDTRTDDGRDAAIFQIMDENHVSYGAVIRQDWLDELNLGAPVTYDDWYETLTAFKNEKGADAALSIPYTGAPMGGLLSAGYGISAYSVSSANVTDTMPFIVVDGTVKYGPYEDAMYDYISMMARWYEEGLIYKDFYSYTDSFYSGEQELALNGRSGIWYSSASSFYEFVSQDEEGFEAVGIADPVLNVGDKNHLQPSAPTTRDNAIVITTDCDNVKLLAKWLDYQFTDDGSFLMVWGLEGGFHDYDEDGSIYVTDLVMNSDTGWPTAFLECYYTCSGGVYVGSYLRNTLTYSDTQTEAVEIWESNDWDYVYPSFAVMTADESVNFSNKYNDIETFYIESLLKFIVGETELSDENFEEFRNTLKELGIEECIQIKQDAYNRYISK